MRSHVLHFLALALCLLCLSTGSVTAQSHWWYPERQSAFTLEFEKNHYNLPEGYETNRGFLTLVGFLGGRHAVAEETFLFWEIPFSNLDIKNESWPVFMDDGGYYWPDYYRDEFVIGNPMFGIEQILGGGMFTRASVRVPLADEDKPMAELSALTTTYDRFEAFLPKLFTVRADIGYREPDPSTPLDAQILIGPTFMIPTEGDPELLVDFSAFVGASIPKAQFGVVFAGRFLVSESEIDFGDRFVNNLGIISRFKLGGIEPGLHLRYNLDSDLREVIDFTYGINIAFPFGTGESGNNDDWD